MIRNLQWNNKLMYALVLIAPFVGLGLGGLMQSCAPAPGSVVQIVQPTCYGPLTLPQGRLVCKDYNTLDSVGITLVDCLYYDGPMTLVRHFNKVRASTNVIEFPCP